MILYFVGDRIVLGLVNARKAIIDRELWRKANNIASKQNIGSIQIYTAKHLASNVYFIESSFGSRALIFGGNIEKHLSDSEIEVLTYASLKMFNGHFAKIRIMFGLLNYAFDLPSFLFRKTSKLQWLDLIYSYLRSPLLLIQNTLFRSRKIKYLDEVVAEETGLGKELGSAIYKLSDVRALNNTFLQESIMNSLTYADNKVNENSSFFVDQPRSQERFQILLSE